MIDECSGVGYGLDYFVFVVDFWVIGWDGIVYGDFYFFYGDFCIDIDKKFFM